MNWQWFLDRLKEPSTANGIVQILIACGLALTPEMQDSLMNSITVGGAFAAALMGTVNIFWKRDSQAK